MMLSTHQFCAIQQHVEDGKISNQLLRDDLLDHLCCLVEKKMEGDGASFEQALKDALHELAPDGLHEIEEETYFLLHFNQQMTMKKIMYLSGLLFTMMTSAGIFLKILHWDLGQSMITFGVAGLLLVFIPLLVVNRYRSRLFVDEMEKVRFVLGALSVFFIGTGGILKFNHLAGAHLSMVAGAIIFTFGFLPLLFFQLYKKSIAES